MDNEAGKTEANGRPWKFQMANLKCQMGNRTVDDGNRRWMTPDDGKKNLRWSVVSRQLVKGLGCLGWMVGWGRLDIFMRTGSVVKSMWEGDVETWSSTAS